MFLGFKTVSVSGSGTRSLVSVSRDPVPDLETQSLEVWYRILSLPYADCLGVREYIVSYYTAVISGLFSQHFDEIFVQLPRNLLVVVLVICTRVHESCRKSVWPSLVKWLNHAWNFKTFLPARSKFYLTRSVGQTCFVKPAIQNKSETTVFSVFT